MRAASIEPNILESIAPRNVEIYLSGRGWKQVDSRPGRFTLWSYPRTDTQVLVPASSDLVDYAVRIAELLPTLESIEGRSVVSIVADMRRVWSDLIRFVREVEGPEQDSISLDAGAALVVNARNALIAAACAAVQPRPYYPTRKPEPVDKYSSHLRMGHTEPGSFIVTIISPLGGNLPLPLFEEFSSEPFERQAARTLLESVESATAAALAGEVHDSVEPLLHSVSRGVSANLLDALAGLNISAEAARVRLVASWARGDGLPAPGTEHVTIPSRLGPLFREASRVLKEEAPLDDINIYGFITELHKELRLIRDTPEAGGTVTIAAQVEGTLRKIKVDLPGTVYQQAADVHVKGTPVRMIGDLRREGRYFVLQNPRQVMFYSE